MAKPLGHGKSFMKLIAEQMKAEKTKLKKGRFLIRKKPKLRRVV